MATYNNDLRLKEITTGDEDGTWGTSTNTNLSLIADALSLGTKQMAADANETFTMPDATADSTRSLYLKITSAVSLTVTRTVTLAPNTVSKVWIIENATSGGQSITIAQGSGSTVTIANGSKVMIATDGAGAGAAVVNANPTTTAGTVTSVSGTGTVNGITLSGTVTSSGNLTLGGTLSNVNLTSQVTGTLPVANGGTGITSFGTGIATFLGTPSSANLAAAVTDETGSGALVFATSPTLVTPALGTPSSATLTNATGLPIVNGTTGTLSVARGGTGATTLTANNVILGNGTSAVNFVAPGTAGNVLTSNGTTWTSAAPATGVTLSANNAFTGANTFFNSTGQTFGTGTSTQDGIIIAGRAGGTSSFRVTISPTTLTASRTLTLANGNTTLAAGTMAVTGTGLGQFASTTSSQLAGVISDETGSGALVFATSPTLVTPVLGTPTSGTLSNCTVDGTDAVGFRNIPQNLRQAAYTLVLADAGKHLLHPSADTTARTWTIPANSSVAFPIGTAITFINQNGAGVITIAITTDTMRLSPAGTTGSRTLAANGSATCIKVTATEWLISGSGLT